MMTPSPIAFDKILPALRATEASEEKAWQRRMEREQQGIQEDVGRNPDKDEGAPYARIGTDPIGALD